MQNAIRSACREGKKIKTKVGEKEELPGAGWRWLPAFLAVLWRRLVAATCSRTATPGGAAAVSDGLVRSLRSSLSLRFLGFFFSVVFGLVLPLFPFLFSVLFFSLPSLSFVLSLPLSLLCFFFVFSFSSVSSLLSPILPPVFSSGSLLPSPFFLPFSLFSVFFSFFRFIASSFPLSCLFSLLSSLSCVLSLPSLSSVFFVFSFFPSVHFSPSVLFSPLLLLCWLLFIEPSEWLFVVEHGEQPAGRPLGATAKARPPSPIFWQVRGGWSTIVSGRWAPGERVAGKKFKLKQPFFLLPRCMFGGKKKNEQCRSKRHRFALSFSFFFLNV